MNTSTKIKRDRQSNFSAKEEILLVDLIHKYGTIIENKETDSEVWKKNAETWDKIDKLMVVSTGVQRGTKALKNKWEKLKRDLKQCLAMERTEMYKTGGGSSKKIKKIENFEKILELLGISAAGLENNFDSDFIDQECNSSKNQIMSVPDTLQPVEPINMDINNMEVEINSMGQSLNLFEDSPQNHVLSLQVDVAENANGSQLTNSWENWTPTSLRQPVSRQLVTGGKKRKLGAQKSERNESNRNEVYEQQVSMIKLEKERTAMRFEWDRVEHELRVEALKLEIEIKKKKLDSLQ